MQVRAMETMELPIRIIAPGRCTARTRWTPPTPQPPGGGHGHRQKCHHGRPEGHPEYGGGAAVQLGIRQLPPPTTSPLPSHSCENGRPVPRAAAWAAPPVGEGPDRDAGQRHDPPQVLKMAGIDPGLLRLDLRHRPGAHRHAPLQDRRPAPDL